MSKKFISLMLAVIILMSSTAAFAKPKTIYVNPKGTYDHMLYKGMRDDTDEVEFPDGELDIAYMQVRLKYYGYYSGSIDGIFGTNTRNAILNFQRRNNLNVDGKIGANTWYALAADDSVHKSDIDFQTIRPGTKGEQVRNVQRRLRVFYNYNGSISGEYDSATTAAVKSFQQSVGLSVDGIVGEKTYNALNSNPSTYFSSSKAPRRTLYMGMRGYDVYILKLRLISLQYLPSSAVKSDPEPGDVSNGYFDLATKNALKRLQVNNGVSVTGQADAASRRYMWSTNTLVAQQVDEAMDPDNISRAGRRLRCPDGECGQASPARQAPEDRRQSRPADLALPPRPDRNPERAGDRALRGRHQRSHHRQHEAAARQLGHGRQGPAAEADQAGLPERV